MRLVGTTLAYAALAASLAFGFLVVTAQGQTPFRPAAIEMRY